MNGAGGQPRKLHLRRESRCNSRSDICGGACAQAINVVTGKSTSLLDLSAALNSELETKIVPQHGLRRAGEVRDSVVDTSLAAR